MSNNDLASDGLPPIPRLVDGHQNEVFLKRIDKAFRYRCSTRTIVRWENAGALPAPIKAGPLAGATPLSDLLKCEESWRAATA